MSFSSAVADNPSAGKTTDEKWWIAGYPLRRFDMATLVAELGRRREQRRKTMLFFANSNFIVRCLDLRGMLRQNDDVIIVNDGVAMDVANRIVNGGQFGDNLNGTDFVPFLLRSAARPFKLFLYGGTAQSVQAAAEVFARMGADVVGYCDGYALDPNETLNAINRSGAELVLVALGNPRQERWILQNAEKLSPTLFAGVGALFDFMSGQAVRAPRWMRFFRLEWFYRLLREPRRLGRRYTIDIVKFFELCRREKS